MREALVYIREIIFLMGRFSNRIPMLLAFGCLLGILDIVGLGLVAQFVSMVLGITQTVPLLPGLPSANTGGYLIGALLIAIFLTRALLGVFSYGYISTISGRIEANLKSDLLLYYQQMRYEDRIARGESELITAINVWTMQYVRAVLVPLGRFVSDALVGCIILSFLGYTSFVSLITFFLLVGTSAIVYDFTLKNHGRRYSKIYQDMSTRITADVQQGLEGYKEIRAFGLERFFQERIKSNATAMCMALARSNTIAQSPRLVIEAVVAIFIVISLYILKPTLNNTADFLPILTIFAVGGVRLVALASLASATLFHLRLYRPSVRKLSDDYAQARLLSGHHAPLPHGVAFERLEVKNLSFTYRGISEAALNSISFHCKAGENLVIVGASGSGKTTLVDLLLGILEPSSGCINVHCSEENLPRKTLVGVASYLSQNTFLLNDSLRRNVAIGCKDKDIDDARVIASLQKAKLHQFANMESLGMILGDRGNKISGGQRQRVALARAFYLGRNVLILDEATNALDLETETEIVTDLLNLKNEITLIAITHRPEIAKLFSQKLVLTQKPQFSSGAA